MREGFCKQILFGNYNSYHCPSKAVINGYCRRHDPETLKARQESREAKWRAERETRDRERAAAREAEERKQRIHDLGIELARQIILSGEQSLEKKIPQARMLAEEILLVEACYMAKLDLLKLAGGK